MHAQTRLAVFLAHTINEKQTLGTRLVALMGPGAWLSCMVTVLPYLVTTAEMMSIDKHWLGSLESCGWLAMVRACLVAAKDVVHLLCIKRHCVMLLGKGSILAQPVLTMLLWYRGEWLRHELLCVVAG